MCFSLIVPFLPLELESSGISSSVSGQIFGAYAAAVIGGSLIMTKLLILLNRKTTLIIGIFLMSFAMAGFGFIKHLADPTVIIVV